MATYNLGITARAFVRNLAQNHRCLNNRLTTNPSYRLLSSKTAKSSTSNTKRFLISSGIGTVLGAGYAVYASVRDKTDHLIHEETEVYTLDKLPNARISRKVVNHNDETDLDLVLFQYQTCPFCCKVRAFLDSKGFSYSVVEVDALLRQDLKWSPYKKVPMLLARTKKGKYVQLTDSSMIVSILATVLEDPQADVGDLAKFYPKVSFVDDDGRKKDDIMNKYFLMYNEKLPKGVTKESMEEERKWRAWTDNHLIHMITPNLYRSTSEALDTFEWFSDAGEWDVNFPRWERNLMVYTGAAAMYVIGKRLKKRYNLSDDVRSHMYNACNQWVKELETRKTLYHGGKTPNLADLAVYGALSSVEGSQAFADILDNTKIHSWYYAMKDNVQKNKGTIISAVA